ncbi:MAG: hypothetical protein DWQ01_06065 [Planctomycetota bacterium]|nr:MAG: hypothetical protein DWQ01_06065 [Planctomycetota bacterium]
MRVPVLLLILLFAGKSLAQEPVRYGPDWESLSSRPFPKWFREAKLGIFIHWGVYSVPAWSGPEQYAEWFLRGLQVGDQPRLDFMHRVYGPDFQYRDFADKFRAELFDPEDWAALFRASGARYVVLTAKHHDGFCLWPSEQAPNWNAYDVGPKRDLVGDLSTAVREAGLRMGLYYSLPEWNHPLYRWGQPNSNNDVNQYVREHMIPQFQSLMSRYRPAVVFSDGDWDHPATTWRSAELLAWLYNDSGCPKDVVVNERWGAGCTVGFPTPEYSAGIQPGARPWVECRGLGRSFGWNRNEKLEAYMTRKELVHFLCRAVSHGGGLLLNVGPAGDGRIPLLQQDRLVGLGEWLAINGEAIYATEAWPPYGTWRDVEVERIDPTLDFDWVRNSPAKGISPDHFEAEWNGFFQAPADGLFGFRMEADDHAELYLDGEAWKAGQSRRMSKGERVPVRLLFREKTHQASVRLYLAQAFQKEVPVPASCWFQDAAGKHPGLKARYRSKQQHLAFTQTDDAVYAICLEWPDRGFSVPWPQPTPDFEVGLVGSEHRFPFLWEDGRLWIETADFPWNQLPGPHAWCFKLPKPPDQGR